MARDIAPEGFLVVDLHGADLLAGPTGAFLVVSGTEDASLERLVSRSEQVRRLMAKHLQWVPFVHPVVLSATPLLVPRAMTLSSEALRQRLEGGRVCIEPETLDKIGEMVERRILHRSVFEPDSAGHR